MTDTFGRTGDIKNSRVNAIRVLSDFDVDSMLNIADTTRYPFRNRAIILLATDAGLTPREISFVRRYHLFGDDDLLGEKIDLRNKPGKYLSPRVIPMPRNSRLWNAMHDLLENAPAVPEDPLIISERAVDGGKATSDPGAKHLRAMRATSIGYVFYKICENAGIPNASAMAARTTFVVKASKHAVEAKKSLRNIQELTGQRSLASIQRVLEASEEDQAAIMRDLFGDD